MTIQINEELRTYIDPLSADEYAALEHSLLAEGCRDALVLWGDVLVDGHNRYELCRKHGIEFKTIQNTRFTSLDDVRLWMIENHLRSEEHTSELQSLMRNSYAVFCLKQKNTKKEKYHHT